LPGKSWELQVDARGFTIKTKPGTGHMAILEFVIPEVSGVALYRLHSKLLALVPEMADKWRRMVPWR
jgi:hypothetical protein